MNKIFPLRSKQSNKDIYYQFADQMMLLCYRYTGNKEDAEEIMNNGFLKVFKHKNRFIENHKNSFHAWIKKIMINECLMFLRKRNAFNVISIDDSKEIIKDELENEHDDSAYLLKLLNELPVGYRTVFNLYAVEGYKHKEIAEMLNISENTSRTQLLKARKSLQLKLKLMNVDYVTR
jgi:RNA polymerase sigma factor (sigma-70 family)